MPANPWGPPMPAPANPNPYEGHTFVGRHDFPRLCALCGQHYRAMCHAEKRDPRAH